MTGANTVGKKGIGWEEGGREEENPLPPNRSLFEKQGLEMSVPAHRFLNPNVGAPSDRYVAMHAPSIPTSSLSFPSSDVL